jgi:hypothetical protein
MRSARARRPFVDPTLIVAQKSAEPISAITLDIWTLSRLLTVEGEECTLLCDVSADAREGDALWDREKEESGTRRSTRSAVASETSVDSDAARAWRVDGRSRVGADGAGLKLRLEVLAVD